MNRKKVDSRIKQLIELNNVRHHRSVFAICGEKPYTVIPVFYNFLRKPKASVLWCYKKELDFRDKKAKRNKKKRKMMDDEADPFEMFAKSTTIRWCYYHETDRILGNSYDVLVLQDFEALTPNVLARTVETVNGGGLIIILLKNINSIKHLCMDIHRTYQTEAHRNVVARFNERFILSLNQCSSFLPVDMEFNVIPINSCLQLEEPSDYKDVPSIDLQKLNELKVSLKSQQPLGTLVDCCKTLDQANAVITFIESLSEKTLRTTISLTAARGRGKSAALGLAIAGAIAFNYCNIFVTSPSPENLKTLFDFVIKGLTAIHLQRNLDYDVINSTDPAFNKAVVRINVLRQFKQTIQYISPKEVCKDSLLRKSAELVVIDEAAAIPLPIVRSLLGPYLVFMSSTINGYEGTGRSLSLKLLRQLRDESKSVVQDSKDDPEARLLREITLKESIRYKDGDAIEKWLNQLLCLEVNNEKLRNSVPPSADDCQLFYISRDTLFSFHPTSEKLLQKLMALYVSSHYKNSPNDLQMMADAPAHHLFCLFGPSESESKNRSKIPEVLCFLQICLEGEISQSSLIDNQKRGKRAAGDLIPWTLSQQFQDTKFPSLSGARVIRIATNPNYQGQGYGKKALELICKYFEGNFITDSTPPYEDQEMDESGDQAGGDEEEQQVKNEKSKQTETLVKKLPPLLICLEERRPERLDYIGVCYGITHDLYRFWKSGGFIPVYIRQSTNELTGENSCIMIKILEHDKPELSTSVSNDWLFDFWIDFRRRFVSLLDRVFKKLTIPLAYEIITTDLNLKSMRSKSSESSKSKSNGQLSSNEINLIFSDADFSRFTSFTKNQNISPHGILDCLPSLAFFFFTQRIATKSSSIDREIAYVLIAAGLQRKSIKEISNELSINTDTIVSMLRKGLKILVESLISIKKNT
ncbi:RNA cytidine acetyltransferase-like [Panonychus citri]|uniref:RNA cytidine acetyltransferase-like n=1 Tax=Panonychus citri TaxID=50023 RepID=UPI00230729D9|nr:RNA cytidine acetyltransferase-like [Panonychus citri]